MISKLLAQRRRAIFIFVGLFTLINVIYFSFSPHFKPRVFAFNASKISRYYIVDADWADQNIPTDNLRNDSIVSEKLLIAELADRIEQEGDQRLKNEAFQQALSHLSGKYKQEVEEKFKEELRHSATHDLFHSQEISYSLLRQLRAEYLEKHADKVKLPKFDKQKYWNDVFKILLQNSPKIAKFSMESLGTKIGGNMFREVRKPAYSKNFLTRGKVRLSDVQFQELQATHDRVVELLRQLELPGPELYQGSGIVISSNSVHLMGALMLTVHLRQLGSELPVEVVLDSRKDYNKRICEGVLPKFDGKCVVTEDVLGQGLYSLLGEGNFQRKSVSFLVSSFDNVIALDADNLPIKDVDTLLTSKAFMDTKFILWPDAWHKGTSPLYYEIARFEIGEPVKRQGFENDKPFTEYLALNKDLDIMFHDLEGTPPGKSVESGQLVFSKVQHFRSLLLSTYYNLNKAFYYPLLYQGVFGSGDRETFVPALHVMNEPYYLNEVPLSMAGVRKAKPHRPAETYLDESTLIQFDPLDSQAFAVQWRRWLQQNNLDARLYAFQEGDYTENLLKKFFEENKLAAKPLAFFLHVHNPKLNPIYNEKTQKTPYDYKTRYIREIGKYNDVMGETDWELRAHSIFRWLVCDEVKDEDYYKKLGIPRNDLCGKIEEYVNRLKADSNDQQAFQQTFSPGRY